MYTVVKPIIFTFTDAALVANRYYYYRLVDYNNTQQYLGKCYCVDVDGTPTIEIDVRRVLSTFSYDGEGTLKPTYNTSIQEYLPSFKNPETATFVNNSYPLVQRWMLYIDSDTDANVVTSRNLYVTAAYDLKEELALPTSSVLFENPLHKYTDLLPHYPSVSTSKYGVMFLLDLQYNFNPGNSFTLRCENTTNYMTLATTNSGKCTVPYAISMLNVINSLSSTSQTTNEIIGGDSTTSYTDAVYGGNSTTSYTNEIVGGDATSAGQGTQVDDVVGTIYLLFGGNIVRNVGIIDDCNADYYLTWQTHSGAPFSYGFNGNVTKSVTAFKTLISNYRYFENNVSSDSTLSWVLNSGNVSKELYDLFGDIFDSKYLYLYDVNNDKSYYCTCNDDTFEYKKARSERRPLNLTLNLKHCETINK